MRYLFVTVDGGGNLYPELALAGRLAGRGHDVRFLGNRSQRTAIGLPPLTSVFEQYRRMDRVLVLTPEFFDFAITSQPLPANVRHVGPQLPPGPGQRPGGQ